MKIKNELEVLRKTVHVKDVLQIIFYEIPHSVLIEYLFAFFVIATAINFINSCITSQRLVSLIHL
jgi:hypothetical protein